MNIWVPKTKIIENRREAIIVPGCRVGGSYKIEGRKPDGRTRLISDWFPNIVTNIGLERWGTAQPVVQCSVGSGTVAPNAGDIALQTWVADATTNSSVIYAKNTASPYYGYGQATFTFAPPGSNKSVAEVGVGWGAGGTNLFSRARVKDSAGADTVVTWLADETLYVYYEARSYPYTSDGSYSGVAITGASTHSGTIRLMNASNPDIGIFHNAAHTMTARGGVPGSVSVSAYSGTIGIITAEPSGTKVARTSSTEAAYSPGSLLRYGEAVWGPNDANFTIQAFGLSPSTHPYQMSISPTIVKQSGWTLALNFQSGSWARYP